MIQTKTASIKSPAQLASMQTACEITAGALQAAIDAIEPKMSTANINAIIHEFILKQGGKPAFLGLYDFPATTCISINSEIVHGIPSENRFVQDGDLVSLDCGTIIDGMYSDMARTVIVGNSSPEKEKLVNCTAEALQCGIDQVKSGNHVADISRAIENHLSYNKYGIVREYVGHGIGTALHEPPQIPNFVTDNQPSELLMIGMTLAIEPMATMGSYKTRVLDDNWTVATADGTLSAHFEDTVVVTEDGCKVLTRI